MGIGPAATDFSYRSIIAQVAAAGADLDLTMVHDLVDVGVFDAGRTLVERQGADVVLLAGTDLAPVFDGVDAGFPVFDCAAAHVKAIVVLALRS